MAISTEHFDALSTALYGGPVKAADFKVMPGDNRLASREDKAAALLASMTRLGIVVDGQLVNLDNR